MYTSERAGEEEGREGERGKMREERERHPQDGLVMPQSCFCSSLAFQDLGAYVCTYSVLQADQAGWGSKPGLAIWVIALQCNILLTTVGFYQSLLWFYQSLIHLGGGKYITLASSFLCHVRELNKRKQS